VTWLAGKTSVISGAENTAGTGEPRANTIRARIRGAVFRRQLRSLRIDPLGIVGLVGLVILWWLLTFVLPGHDLPAPRAVVARLLTDFLNAPRLAFYGLSNTGLLDSMLYTASNVLIAAALGSIIGSLLGLVTARLGLVRAITDPVMLTAGTVPILVTAPFFLIWFGTGRLSSMLLVTIYVAVILYIYAQRAADNLDPVYENSARTLGATDAQLVRDVLIPAVVPEILGGVRIALAGCWGLEAIAELLGAQYGIGKIVQVLAGSADIEGIFAALLFLGLVAVLVDAIAASLISRATSWSVASTTGGR
jgi:ABC-type nitrate/sulfonate/bicarbonate transport system permease component